MDSTEEPASSMPTKYLLKQAKSKADMDGIMDVIWAANYTPYDPIAQLFFPVLGFTAADREASLTESKERFWNQHISDPSSNWFFVVDLETERAVGCAQWQIFTSNPFSEGAPNLTAPWWPEGEYRDFCETILKQIDMPRANWMRRPHLALSWMAVIPTHRRIGIGSLLMAAGISRADELNLESWMVASDLGRPLYEKHGFRSLLRFAFDTDRKDGSDVWRKCTHELTPPPVSAMWRPKRGAWQAEGQVTRMPWELGTE